MKSTSITEEIDIIYGMNKFIYYYCKIFEIYKHQLEF